MIKKFDVRDEFSPLKQVIVSRGESIPDYDKYTSNHIEFTKYHINKWDRSLLLKQQNNFFEILKKHHVELLFTKINKELIWQMYTRDTGFVYRDKFFYCNNRGFPERKGEFNSMALLFSEIEKENIIEIKKGKIEGGDVLADNDQLYIGISSRTNKEAIEVIEKYFPVKKLYLGNDVMHLDTKMTILPNKNILIYPEAFTKEDLSYLKDRFEFITVTKEETLSLGTNVLVINPKTIVIHKAHKRIQRKLIEKGFDVELIDYSEPIALCGSFRCTTLPVFREY